MVLVAIILAASTFIERMNPDTGIYSRWWFIVILAMLGLGTLARIVNEKMWQRPSLLLTHTSILLILLGGGLTTWVGRHGSVKLMPGVATCEFETEHSGVKQLPFSITLDQFEIISYTGTQSPMDFVSHVTVDGERQTISMNNILRHKGYRFYQEDYGDDGSSTLSVSHDPWGIAVTYCGYVMLIAGLLWLMFDPRGQYRRLLKKAAIALLLLLPVTASATPNTLPRQTADKMGQLHVLYKGRVCPLQTLAKDFTTKLTGNATYHGLTPEQVLSGYLFYYYEWVDEPAIKVKRGQWMQAYGLEASRASMSQLMFLDTITVTPATDKSLRATAERQNLVKMLQSGKLLKIYPVTDSTGTLNWYGQSDNLPLNTNNDEYIFVRRSLSYFQELVAKGDFAGLEAAFDKTRQYQEKRYTPVKARVRAERMYNALTTGRWLAMACITVGLLAFAYSLVCRVRKDSKTRTMPKWMTVSATIWVALLTAFILLIFVLRWIAGGHAPMAGGFDSMNLMAFVIGIVALTFSRRYPEALPAGMLTMGFCLLAAMMSGSNPPVTNLMPVLNSPLLTLHVTVIMCSYALFFFIMMGGIAGLATGSEEYRKLNLMLLYPAVALLALGIIIGAVWANISWGHYWAWDPKEVWALITLLVYAIPLYDNVLNGKKAFYIYCIAAFLSVIITYFGVNMILGGMHSYN